MQLKSGMLKESRVLVFDVDGTLCPEKGPSESYADLQPYAEMVAKLRAYRAAGYHIIIQTARHMRTAQGNVGEILAKYAPILLEWLARHDIPYDELHFGKPWAGRDGFYIDDRAIRPDEFLRLDETQIRALLAASKPR